MSERASGAIPPLAIPDEFDPAVDMISRRENTGLFHASRLGAEFAAELVANGADADLQLGERVITSVLSCQERRDGDPHVGNFRWEMEDEGVEDLNAVHFILIQLVPTMVRFADRLTATCRDRVADSIRIALEEVERIDVGLEYTNIVLKDITNTILGGEVLGHGRYVERGKEKLARWMRTTYRSGGVFEINSPVYTPLALRVLHVLSSHTRDPEVAVQARLIAARIGLSYALRIHPRTGRLAGPYCRAYRPQLLGEFGSEKEFLLDAAATGALPEWVRGVIGTLPVPAAIREGFDVDRGLGYATWLSRSYAIGTADRELDSQENRFIAGQSNVFTMNFTTPEAEMGGMVYCRYILDDKWLGDYRTTNARSNHDLLLDEGRFYGVQAGSKSIGVYAPREMGAWHLTSSAKLAIVIARRDFVREIALDGVPVEALPADVPDGAAIGFGFEDALLVIRPFSRTDLGRDAPIRIVQRKDDLVLEIYNYLGPAKTFWELARPGSFYRGQPQCAFYAEAAERSDAGTLAAFTKGVMAGTFTDAVDPLPGSASRDRPRAWTLGYTRTGVALELAVDLMEWEVLHRSAGHDQAGYTLLDSPVARQGRGDVIEVGGATLDPGRACVWLYGNRTADTWVFGGIAEVPTDIVLTMPGQTVRVTGFAFGMVMVEGGTVQVDANRGVAWTST